MYKPWRRRIEQSRQHHISDIQDDDSSKINVPTSKSHEEIENTVSAEGQGTRLVKPESAEGPCMGDSDAIRNLPDSNQTACLERNHTTTR